MWKVRVHSRVHLNNPKFIEGLPGIGNVGKITVDYIVNNFKATLLRTYTCAYLPATAFVNSKNIVEVPKIFLFHASIKGEDFLFLAGDVQPTTSESVYAFCSMVLNDLKKLNASEIVTLGGIGYSSVPETPSVLCASASKDLAEKFVKEGVNQNVFGTVGPILGITGLLVGLSKEYNLKATALLVETFNHPTHLGIVEAKSLIRILDKVYGLGISFKHIDDQIEKVNKGTPSSMGKVETSYIG